MLVLTRHKYRLPYHWLRDPLHHYSLPYFGYVAVVLRQLPPAPATVLDAGCGDGRVAAEMVRQGYQVAGCDLLKLSVVYARTMVPDGDFFVADLTRPLAMQPARFDAAVLVEVYEHIPPVHAPMVLENVYRALRPGGRLIISVPSKQIPMSKLHYRHFDVSELEAEMQAAGFQLHILIRQHSLDRITTWLLSNDVYHFLNNQWLQPQFLKRWRQQWYMRYANVVPAGRACGRYIAVATRGSGEVG